LDDRTQIWILDIQDWTPIPLARSDQLLGDQAEVGVAVEGVLVGERGLSHKELVGLINTGCQAGL
jgi:hypothetical protein